MRLRIEPRAGNSINIILPNGDAYEVHTANGDDLTIVLRGGTDDTLQTVVVANMQTDGSNKIVAETWGITITKKDK